MGIGATTAVFSVVYGVLLRPLPYPDADRLVRLSEEHPGAVSPLRAPMLSNLTYYAWSASPRTIDQFAGYRSSAYTVTRDGASSRLEGADVTPSLFAMLGETPALGRFLRDDDVKTGSASGRGAERPRLARAVQRRPVDRRTRHRHRRHAGDDRRRREAGSRVSEP